MNYAKFRYHVLCEDRAHYHFVQGWLEKKGVQTRAVHLVGNFPHPGCGKQYVQNAFEAQMARLRRARGQNIALIVVRDADNEDAEACARNFDSTDGNMVFVVIPKWSIDTWARFLTSPDHADALCEDKSCKTHFREKTRWASIGKQLAAMPYASATLPSLKSTWDRVKAQKSSMAE